MKKSKLILVGIIALLMSVGMVLASCGRQCSEDGQCFYRNTSKKVCKYKECSIAQSTATETTKCDCPL